MTVYKRSIQIKIMLENPILTCRFNNETFEENQVFRDQHPELGCVYGSPLMLNGSYTFNSLYFVVEMNNQCNRIEGIGLIVNKVIISDPQYSIYKNGNYNRYTYKGKYRLSRDLIERYNPALLEVFDYILFKEKTHLKRGSGFTKIPKKLYEKEICQTAFQIAFEKDEQKVEQEQEQEGRRSATKAEDLTVVEEEIKRELSRLFKTYCPRHI